ncbi:septation protein SepH [Trueperella pyogenes]|uniref:septation protein SepH n=1 Tax=Trueperella pyogenes TaxID=1661 RepID=UPI00324A5EC7
MIELELLGLQDGQKLSLNDSEGNRYVLPITDELRAALRTDINAETDQAPRPITPREIQAYFRAGHTVAEVSEISSLPPSQLTNLAYPIFAEREYVAQNARLYRQGHEAGGMTLEELVTSRLVTRDVAVGDIEWDAHREQGEPWMLVATYKSGGTRHTAMWAINTKAQTLSARNDEAIWLTENQIPAPTNPWRRPNTPSANNEPPAGEKMSIIDAKPAAADSAVDIDSMLASLNSKRGKVQPMPEFDGAHPAASEPEAAQDATILPLPIAAAGDTSNSSEPELPSASSPEDVDGQQTIPGVKSTSTSAKPKKRRNRPEMPSWDEIVFGYSKDD